MLQQMKKRILNNKIVLLLILLFIPMFIIIGSKWLLNKNSKSAIQNSAANNVQCTVFDKKGDYIFVAPALNSKELENANCYQIEITEELKNVEVGHIVSVMYNGELKKEYPSKFNDIESLSIVYKLPQSTVTETIERMTKEEIEIIEKIKMKIKEN